MVLKNKVIVFFGNIRFDSSIQATSLFIARNLAKDNKVFFIDYPFTIKDYFNSKHTPGFKERQDKFSFSSDGLVDTDLPNLKIVVVPPLVPINFLPEGFIFRSMLRINEAIINSRLNKILKKEGISDYIYINSFNFHYPNISPKIKPALTVYQCVDPMIVPYDMKHGITSEAMLVKESDLVICTSKALYEEKRQFNKHTYFVPNGTDSVHALKMMDPTLKVHKKIKDLPKPIVGYLGTIERRINYELVEKVAMINPDKTFVFAGPVSENFMPQSLIDLKNVYLTGAVPYSEVPQMIKSFDLAIIPFKKDEVSATIFPIKLFEYLSAGKPVIATDFNPDLKEYTEDQVDYCADPQSFSQAINKALDNDSPEKAKEREALAKKNTWEERTDEIAEIIYAHLS